MFPAKLTSGILLLVFVFLGPVGCYEHPAPDAMHFVLDLLLFLVVGTIALGLLRPDVGPRWAKSPASPRLTRRSQWVDATLARNLLSGVYEADFVREC